MPAHATLPGILNKALLVLPLPHLVHSRPPELTELLESPGLVSLSSLDQLILTHPSELSFTVFPETSSLLILLGPFRFCHSTPVILGRIICLSLDNSLCSQYLGTVTICCVWNVAGGR